MPQDANRKVALVTGADRGVGLAVSTSLLRAGYKVIVTGRCDDALHDIVASAKSAAREAYAVASDLSNPASVDALFTEIKNMHGRLDVFFNNPSSPSVLGGQLTPEDWKRAIDSSLTGIYLCTHAAFSSMSRQRPAGGHIITNSAIAVGASRQIGAYQSACMRAIGRLTRRTSRDGRQFNIACTRVDIPHAFTDLSEPVFKAVRAAAPRFKIDPSFDMRYVGDAVACLATMSFGAPPAHALSSL